MTMSALRNVHCRVSASPVARIGRFDVFGQHRVSCLECQARTVRQRRLDRQLRSLADVTVAAPAGLAANVMARLDSAPALGTAESSGPDWSWLVPAAAAAGCAMALAFARRAASAV